MFASIYYRWDISATDQLPEYMKVCYQALLDVYCEMEEIVGERRSDRVKYAIEAVSTININLEYYCSFKRKKERNQEPLTML